MTTVEVVSTVLGAVGTTLGILTSLKLFLDDRVRLKVSVQASTLVGHGTPYEEKVIAFSVVNMSRFPVTVNLVGLETDDPRADWIALNPRCSGNGDYVRRLEPREGYSLFLPQKGKERDFIKTRRPWATTVCGAKIFGSKRQGRALRQWALKKQREEKNSGDDAGTP